MSDLAGKIQSDLVAAMKNKDELKLSVLRMLKSAMQLAQVEKGKENALTDDDVLVLVRRLIKHRASGLPRRKQGAHEHQGAQSAAGKGYRPFFHLFHPLRS